VQQTAVLVAQQRARSLPHQDMLLIYARGVP
jgi:hypothetical protein